MARADLTPREVEALEAVTRPNGSRNGAAAALGISRRSLDCRLERAFRKLGVNSIGAAARVWWGRTDQR